MTDQIDTDTISDTTETSIEAILSDNMAEDDTDDSDDMSEMLAGEIESELEKDSVENEDFEEAVRKALASVDGELLFQVHAEHAEDYRHVAAISIGTGPSRKLALVILPIDSTETRIEPAESSANPLAPIARSYASLLDAYQTAA